MANQEIIKKPEGGLLQSREWADFLCAKGEDVVSVDNVNENADEQLFGAVYALPMVGKYLYMPRLSEVNQGSLALIIKKAQEKNCGWVRADVGSEKVLETLQTRGMKIVQAPHNMQPRENYIIDITPSDEDLLAAMKSKTRYNIRLAEKKNVAVHCVTKSDDDFGQMLTLFYTMVEETARRKGVTFHSKEHYQNMFDALPEDMMTLFAAEVDGGIFIAANIVTFYNGTATYLHGATADTHRNLMAPFLLQWAAIRAAKSRDYQYYDFGGVKIDEEDNKDNKKNDKKNSGDWAGITRFKQGFAPSVQPIIGKGSYDIILDTKRYYLYRFLQKLRSIF